MKFVLVYTVTLNVSFFADTGRIKEATEHPDSRVYHHKKTDSMYFLGFAALRKQLR